MMSQEEDDAPNALCLVQIILPRTDEAYLPAIRRVAKLLPCDVSVQELLRIIKSQMRPSENYTVRCGNTELDEHTLSIKNFINHGKLKLHVETSE